MDKKQDDYPPITRQGVGEEDAIDVLKENPESVDSSVEMKRVQLPLLTAPSRLSSGIVPGSSEDPAEEAVTSRRPSSKVTSR